MNTSIENMAPKILHRLTNFPKSPCKNADNRHLTKYSPKNGGQNFLLKMSQQKERCENQAQEKNLEKYTLFGKPVWIPRQIAFKHPESIDKVLSLSPQKWSQKTFARVNFPDINF